MGSVQHRPDRSKPWRARYRGPDGREHSKSFERKTDANRWLRSELSKLDRGEWLDPAAGTVRLGEWAEVWLDRKTRIKPKTRKGYRSILDSRILPRFGNVPVASIRREDVSRWVTDLSEARVTDRELTPSSVRQAHQCLHAILEEAVVEGLIGRNPARRVELPRLEEPERHFLTPEQVARLADSMPSRQYRTMVYVLAYGGLRWGEMVALRRGRVDVLRRQLHIVESAAEVTGGMVFGPPKTHASRKVSLPSFVADLLGEHLANIPDDPAAFVFPSTTGGPLWYRHGRKLWDRAREEAGPDLEDITPHDLRHSCASLMRAVGADAKAIQQQLGHRSPVVTMTVYTHLFEGEMEDVMDRLDGLGADLARPQRGPEVTDLDTARSEKRA